MLGLIFPFNLLWALFIASIIGAIGSRLAGRRNLGCLTSIVLGFIGALLGGWIASKLGLPLGPIVSDLPVIWAIIGAALFIAVLNLLSGRR
jgi:uncharacterized membrane protein YeaQ/YmgE (transglycosylase-associated protein family)